MIKNFKQKKSPLHSKLKKKNNDVQNLTQGQYMNIYIYVIHVSLPYGTICFRAKRFAKAIQSTINF